MFSTSFVLRYYILNVYVPVLDKTNNKAKQSTEKMIKISHLAIDSTESL